MKFKDKNILLGLRRTGGGGRLFVAFLFFVKLFDFFFKESFLFRRAHYHVPIHIYKERIKTTNILHRL